MAAGVELPLRVVQPPGQGRELPIPVGDLVGEVSQQVVDRDRVVPLAEPESCPPAIARTWKSMVPSRRGRFAGDMYRQTFGRRCVSTATDCPARNGSGTEGRTVMTATSPVRRS